jgi:tetratricopeptide (TPR) repeat protein
LLSVGIFFFLNAKGQGNNEVHFLKGDYASILNNTGDAGSAEDYYWISLALEKTGKSLEGISLLEQALIEFPESILLERILAKMFFNTGQFYLAKPYLIKYQKNPDEFLMLIKVLENEAEFVEAISLLKVRLSKDSTNIDYLKKLGDYYNQIDSLDAAILQYRKLVDLNPNDQLSLAKLANIYLSKKSYAAAISVCDSALQIDSTNKVIIKIKGFALFRKGEFESAKSNFSYLLEEGDSGIVLLKHLGISESKSYAYHDSRKHLLMAYEIDSMDYEICFFLARGYLNSRTPEAGIFFLDRADSLIQADPAILTTIYTEKASIYSTLEMFDEVLYYYLLSYKKSYKPEYLYYIGSLYSYRFNNKQKALEYYSRFLEELPDINQPVNNSLKNQSTVSMKKVASEQIEILREELFFEGALNDE